MNQTEPFLRMHSCMNFVGNKRGPLEELCCTLAFVLLFSSCKSHHACSGPFSYSELRFKQSKGYLEDQL